MKLKEILSDESAFVIGDEDTEVSGVSYDSRKIGRDYAFFSLPGHNTDGRKYVAEAIANGASVIITDSKYDTNDAVQVVVKDIFRFMSLFGAKFYNYPDRELNIIGITGTNGKTTVTYMIESILVNSGIECGVIGTVNYRYKGKVIKADNTTPQSLDIYGIMRDISDSGIKYLVMEVSSHALSLDRVYGIEFDTAVFTNLTREHLDFHKNMDEYFEVKSALFKELGAGKKSNKKCAIINVDDKYGEKLLKMEIRAEVKLYSAIEKNVADFKASNIEITNKGAVFDLVFCNERAKIRIKHIGLYNVYNALAALAAVVCSGISFEKAVEGLNDSRQAPGRLEKVNTIGLGFEIVVDYAHTDDALENVLRALKEIKPKRIITVFGCGGDRDRAKRPLMGKTAVEMSDFVFVTSDNPRTEDSCQIILDIEVGIKRAVKKNYKIVVDRETAIKEAVMMADKGDIVLLAGKGHETYQITSVGKVHFNDVEIAEKYIDLREKQKIVAKQTGQREFIF
ncbi:MAG: UDP-N-acetylmuramoyl-L-alanyl-D-glutamate--2,6-diaminopimelate ligase [Endomicrobium sp.]|jgi:UDP-N-acetylmuramoyl-L-alanyl-D-glutamate--2,6-diaminopimelate ligase|nr:UDP-N-acetylmuramoyl-L-alanyl-D-glutamate--2,6-diaminopimelate ligase [Endomicrobium sp.]